LLHLAGWLPLGAGRALGRTLGRLGLALRPGDRTRADANLAVAFPDLDAAGRKDLLRRSAEAAGLNLWDTLAAPRLLAAGRVTEARGGETGRRPLTDLLADLAAPGRGVILLTGHLGCWELLGGWLGRQLPARGLGPLAVVTGRVHNPAVDRLLQDRRRALGLVPLPRDAGPRPLLRHLDRGGVAAILLDQNVAARTESVPFFGRPAPTAAGLAVIALRRRIPVLPVAIARDDAGGHVVLHREPLVPGADESVRGFLERCNAQLEALIRRNPAEWVWFHRRWSA
jgi:KDO2-lipid IV(A) lauroyltransferase